MMNTPFAAFIVGNLLLFLLTSALASSYLSIDNPAWIKSLSFDSPRVVGDNFRMYCDYELGDETLRAVKWYRGYLGWGAWEFFRYEPNAEPPFRLSDAYEIEVDISKCDNNSIYFRNITLKSSGRYTCKIFTDDNTSERTRELQILAPPTDGPFLQNEKPYYEIGDNVSILCVSGKASPAPKLQWYINNELAPEESCNQSTTYYWMGKLKETKLTLRFHLTPDIFDKGKVVLKCVSTFNETDSVITTVITKEITPLEPFRIKKLQVPSPNPAESSVRLECEYEIGDFTLSTLTWKMNMMEFFRYDPDTPAPFKFWPSVSVNVDRNKSNNVSVYIRNLKKWNHGYYSCEIISSKPFIKTVEATAELQVFVPPTEGPFIVEENVTYEFGGNVSFLCVSGEAKPAPDLKWFINDQMVQLEDVDREIIYRMRLQKSTLPLHFRLTRDVVRNEKVSLKCVSTFNHTHTEIVKEIKVPHKPLSMKMLHIPTPVMEGESVQLNCEYDVGSEALHSVRWYLDKDEFFRYGPNSNPSFKILSEFGRNVDVSRSDESTVYLRNITLENSGNYTCVIQTDAPYSSTAQDTKQLQVLVPPMEEPIILEETPYYKLGDYVSLMCISGKAKPAPDLKWYINEQLVISNFTDKEIYVYPNGLECSNLALRFHLKPNVLYDGKVNLKCVSTFNLMHTEIEKEIKSTELDLELTEDTY